MADDEGGTPAGSRRPGSATPNRGKSREAPLIEETALPEGAARHGPDEAATSDPTGDPIGNSIGMTADAGFGASPERDPEIEPAIEPTPVSTPFEAAPATPPRPAAKRRSRVPALMSVLAGLIVLLLGGLLYTLYHPLVETSSGVGGDLDGLKQRVAALEKQPTANPADLLPISDRITALEGAVATLRDTVGALGGRLDAVSKPAGDTPPDAPVAQAAAPAPSVDLAPVQDRLVALESAVKDLQKPSAPQPDPAPVAASVAALTTEVATLKSSVAELPRVDLAPVKAEVADLGQRLAPVESALAAPKAAQQVTEARQEGSAAESRAAPLAVTGNAVLRAIDAGRPFTAETAALKTLGVGDAKLAALSSFATAGAPTVAQLLSEFDAVRSKLAGAAPSTTGNVLDRFLAGAQGLVKVRQAGVAAGNDPGAVVSRIEADLRASDLPAALGEWNALPADGQAASRAWADRLKARIEADRAAQAIVTDAIAAIGSAR